MRNFERMIQDMKSGRFDRTEGGRCSDCGGCCSKILPVSEREIRSIRKYAGGYYVRRRLIHENGE